MGKWLRGRTGASRVLPLIGRHVLWIALFTLPAIVLWWHVWTGHPSSTLTCRCGDPAQEVWFMAWPAWAIAHAGNPFFSGAANVPHGANLLSNTAGTLVSMVLAPVTWLWGPVAATNVALTLAPGLSAWGCWLALRSFVSWKPGTIPAALVYGYSAAIVTSLMFGHVSVSVLPVPPLILASLYAILVRQAKTPWRDGLLLAALVVVQFLISPEILVMCLLLAVVGLVVTVVLGWRTVSVRLPYAAPALGIGVGVSAALLAYPAWFGVAGPQAVSGVLFPTAALSGVLISGYLSPGPYGEFAASARFGGYLGPIGPTTNYIGWDTAAGTAAAVFLARRRPLVWVLVLLGLVTMWLSLGPLLLGRSSVLWHGWMPWRMFGSLPVLKEILPDQLGPFTPLFISFILALGLDAVYCRVKAVSKKQALRVEVIAGLATIAIGVAALLPVFLTFDMPFTVQSTAIPAWMARDAPTLQPMLWQAVDDMHFRLAGAALKTPDATGGPVGQGEPGSARRVLTDLTVGVGPEPGGTAAQLSAVRAALRDWRVNEVVIDGPSRDPAYASGFLTAALGAAPSSVRGAWVWKIPTGGLTAPPAPGDAVARCQASAAGSTPEHHPLAMAACVRGATPSG
jgi:dolichyl-phosphate beta-glucosyltransferase